ncbi:MAG: hypothetical protein JWP91_1670 [Fibrobacteres bacterium]|nr:hypothetical protein [Fibrobacterota bacterium]
MNNPLSETSAGTVPRESLHYVAVLEGIPHCYHGGGGITAYAAVKAMRERGNRVTVIALSRDPKPGNDDTHIRELREIGIDVRMIDAVQPPRRRFSTVFPSDEYLFPGLLQRDAVKSVLAQLAPDAVFMYHWNALAAMRGIRHIPKFGSVGDPAHLPYLFRSSFMEAYEGQKGPRKKISNWLRRLLVVPRLVRMQEEMLAECQVCGAFAAHHADLFSRSAGLDCLYLHTPTPDPLPQARIGSPDGKFKIMHIGHLQGIATLAGVELLANTILPRLKSLFAPGTFEIHLVGGFFDSMPPSLQEAMRDPHVRIRGQVSPADAEFLSSDVVLVPTPIELGIRVRIITAFSFGNCIVAHSANQKGIPELEHGVNAMIASDGGSLAEICKRLYDDPALRSRLREGSRRTYEEKFSLAAAGGRISDVMDGLVKADRRVPAR